MVRLAVLAKQSPANNYLVNRLLLQNQVVALVLEKKRNGHYLRVLANRIRKIGICRVIDQVILLGYVKLFENRQNQRRLISIFNDAPFEKVEAQIATLCTEDVNSRQVLDFLGFINPDLIVINGTSLLQKQYMEAFPGKILNLHVGITPEYRGAHGGFWALYNEDMENLGVTVHMVDKGIDTGAIIFQERVQIAVDDTLNMIVSRQQKIGVDLLLKAVRTFEESGSLQGCTREGSSSRLYYSPGLSHYLRIKSRQKLSMRNAGQSE